MFNSSPPVGHLRRFRRTGSYLDMLEQERWRKGVYPELRVMVSERSCASVVEGGKQLLKRARIATDHQQPDVTKKPFLPFEVSHPSTSSCRSSDWMASLSHRG